MSKFPRTPFGLLCAGFLVSGCVVDLVAMSAVVITAPVWVPIEYGVSQSKIRQPVVVTSVSGKVLTPAFAGEPEAGLTIASKAVICKGAHNFQEKLPSVALQLQCNARQKGRIRFVGLTTSKAVVTVGPNTAPQNPNGGLTMVSQECEGNFNVEKTGLEPFLLECKDGRFGAISPDTAGPEASRFTIWLPPPL